MRTSLSAFNVQFNVLRRVTGVEFVLDKNAQGYRLLSPDGSFELSPRLSRSQFTLWMEGMVAGYQMARQGW